MKVLGWKEAIELGFEPKEYPYKDFEIGLIQAQLDFKIWSNKIMGINCYFTNTNTLEKFLLTIHRDRETECYVFNAIDFQYSENTIFDMELGTSKTGKIKLMKINLPT